MCIRDRFTGCAENADSFIEYSLSDELYVDGQRISSYEYAELAADVGDLVAETEALFDAEAEGSDVFRINAAAAGEAVTVDARTYALLSLCKQLYTETDGAFTPALYDLSAVSYTHLAGQTVNVDVQGGKFVFSPVK